MLSISQFLFNRRYFTATIFVLYVLLYFLIYGKYGWNDTDEGFILASSWRIFNGQVPYRDFILIYPPLSYLAHSITFYIIPDNYQIIFERFLFYFSIAVSSYFAASAIEYVFTISKSGLDKYLLATIGFILSVHTFPPMPWYTVDGVLFSSIGIFLIVRYEKLPMELTGIFLLFLSALCKQPFYLMPFAGLFYILIKHRNLKRFIYNSCGLIVFLSVLILILIKYDILNQFIQYTTGSTNLKDLVKAGIYPYWRFDSAYFVTPLVLGVLLVKLSSFYNQNSWIKLIPAIFISVLLLNNIPSFITSLHNNKIPVIYSDSVARMLFILTFFYILINFASEIKWSALLFLILLSWCAGISWGYPTPVFFSTPLIAGFFLVAKQYFRFSSLKRLVYYVLFFSTIVYYIGYQVPMRDSPRKELTYRLDNIFPKMKYIRTDNETFQKYSALKELSEKYPVNFKTMPGVVLSNYLTNTVPTLAIDLVIDNGVKNINDILIPSFRGKSTVFFIEKQPALFTVNNPRPEWKSTFTLYVMNNLVKIDSNQYFNVYQ